MNKIQGTDNSLSDSHLSIPFPDSVRLNTNYLLGFPDGTQLSIAIVKNQVVSFQGLLKQGPKIISVENQDKAFEIGSVTKVFTACLLGQLVTDGIIELDRSIDNALGFPLNRKSTITYRQLANHTSGLPVHPRSVFWNAVFGFTRNPFSRYSQKDLLKYLQHKMKLHSPPGKTYQYSNIGYGVLGTLLSKLERSSFESLLQNRIFSKSGMDRSTSQCQKATNYLVEGLDDKGRKVQNWDFLAMEGAGAILSTTEDLAKFASAQFNGACPVNKLIQNSSFDTQQEIQLGNNRFEFQVGLGWHLLKHKTSATNPANSNHWLWHNGGTNGYHSSMVLNTENNTGVIILSNVSVYHKKMANIENLLFELMRDLE